MGSSNLKGSTDCRSWDRRIQRRPVYYIDRVMPLISACGFYGDVYARLAVRSNVTERIADPGIEKRWWVEIKVNGYSITRANETDASVYCLNDIDGTVVY